MHIAWETLEVGSRKHLHRLPAASERRTSLLSDCFSTRRAGADSTAKLAFDESISITSGTSSCEPFPSKDKRLDEPPWHCGGNSFPPWESVAVSRVKMKAASTQTHLTSVFKYPKREFPSRGRINEPSKCLEDQEDQEDQKDHVVSHAARTGKILKT